MGGAHSLVEACIGSPTSPLMLVNIPQLCFTHNHCSVFLCTGVPSTQSTWPQSPPRLGIQPQDLGHCGFSAASTHKLTFTRRHYALLTATDIQSELIFRVRTTMSVIPPGHILHYWMPMPTGNWEKEKPPIYKQ